MVSNQLGKNILIGKLSKQLHQKKSITFNEAEKSLVKILKAWSDISEVVPIADKWKNEKMILEPGEVGLQGKEIPIDTFFHKITMTRDRLRVMEQKINSSKLEEDEKINLQQYLTRIYGSFDHFQYTL